MGNRIAIVLATLCAAGLMLMAVAVSAADDPSIRGKLRPQIHATVDDHVISETVDGLLRLYDPIEDRVLRMEIITMREGIVRKGDFYVSGGEFVDQDGRKLEVDFLVLQNGETLQVTQAIVHKIDGAKRKYHLASK